MPTVVSETVVAPVAKIVPPAPPRAQRPAPKKVAPLAAAPAVVAVVSPEPEARATEEFTNLEVIVRQEQPGPVRVRILAPDRTEVRRLYEGALQAGQWSFKWDGILATGQAATPGQYLIEIEKGSVRKTQEVIIH